MPDDEIAQVLSEHKDPQRAADELKRIVHQRGADDNLTAIVVQMGRPKQTPIIAIDDGLPKDQDHQRPTGARNAEASVSRVAARRGRIQVDVNQHRVAPDEPPRRLERQDFAQKTDYDARNQRRSGSRTLMYALLVLVLVAAAFYGGLRAPEFINTGAATNANRETDALQAGREAFERGDYKVASAEFESLTKRDASNSRAHYWLGRAQLEQREYESAVKSFEEAIGRQPVIYDAYVQQAAAYEALGERAKAAAALARSAEERRKIEHQPTSDRR
jgi:TolA-binding protein